MVARLASICHLGKNLSAAIYKYPLFCNNCWKHRGFLIFSRVPCCRQRRWGPGTLSQGGRSGACLARAATPLSVYTHVLGKTRLLRSKQRSILWNQTMTKLLRSFGDDNLCKVSHAPKNLHYPYKISHLFSQFSPALHRSSPSLYTS